MWSPGGLLPTEREILLRERAIAEAAKISDDIGTVAALMNVCRTLKRQLEACPLDKDWALLFRQKLTMLEGVVPENMDLLVRYHGMLQNTGQGWTYVRSVQEMVVKDSYHPQILATLRDHMTSTTQLSGERLQEYDPDDGQLEAGVAAMLGSASANFKQIGVLQFFAQADRGANILHGPTSQETTPVFVNTEAPTHNFRPQEEADRLLNEEEFHGTLVQEVFTRTNSDRKLFEIRPEEVEGMSFCQWLCDYRRVRRSTLEYIKECETLERAGNYVGQRSEKTMIAGTLEMAPKVMLLPNDQMVKLRQNGFLVPMLLNEDQVLSDKMKITLFGRWRRLEKALRDPEQDVKQCDAVRMILFPSSQHKSE